jgi:hypothetical protein
MKKALFIVLVTIIAGTAVIATSCKKDKEKTPDYPELIGSWVGTTNQKIPIRVDVADIGGDLYVTRVNLEYSKAPGDTVWAYKYNSDGLTMLSGKSFTYNYDAAVPQSYINGTFQSDTLNGVWYVYDPTDPITGTYQAVKSK